MKGYQKYFGEEITIIKGSLLKKTREKTKTTDNQLTLLVQTQNNFMIQLIKGTCVIIIFS